MQSPFKNTFENPVFKLEEHKHGDHSHIKLELGKVYTEKGGLKISDEGFIAVRQELTLMKLQRQLVKLVKKARAMAGR